MPLNAEDREYVISTVVDLLRHRNRQRLLRILEQRLRRGDYPDAHEEDLDRVAHALAQTIDDGLQGGDR